MSLDNTSKILLAFITLLLGIILIGSISTETLDKVSTEVKTETVNLAPARLSGGALNTTYPFTLDTHPSWRADSSECIPTTIGYKNQTGDAMTVTTNYVFTSSTGLLTVTNLPALNDTGSNTTTASYAYCPDDYLNLSWGRTLLNLISGFFAIALLLISVGLFYSVAKDNGIA